MGYEIGDKIIYMSPFNKPMIGKVVHNVNNNYLIDLSNNTGQWATNRELSWYNEKEDYIKLRNKFLEGKSVDVLGITLLGILRMLQSALMKPYLRIRNLLFIHFFPI